ncbi:guanine nucleotide-binding protein G(s) subunit alpha-like [Magallana gigas]|uniref:guanine nucleotide-binding protein G(s) subunit alpha-like n=1 Tax=Magallana gigas TaxID=29159 RepID=UPI0005C3A469|eukprot:XP_011440328.1 PREDICTED: guanine nucleotide-binding protein G(s) subunit alpha-like [Crassostrea gigas]
MQEKIKSLFRPTSEDRFNIYQSAEEAKNAKLRNKQISKVLKQHKKEELKKLKILLLGTAESGKSTITKQMKIIHSNGFDMSERLEKISDIRRNIQQSIVVLLSAMDRMKIPLHNKDNELSRDFIMKEAGNPESHRRNEFLDHVEQLWNDAGVQECYGKSHGFQLIDCAKYFLDKIPEIKSPAYVPSDQDILRCRSLTTSIQHTEFEVPDGGHQVKFDVYDVGGQQGERKKWIQVFDSVTAILFVVDCSSFDQTLREDPDKNRLLEALENFEQVWNNRFLRFVSVLLFINKIDVLAEKIARGRDIAELTKLYPEVFPNFEKFTPSKSDIMEFLEAYPSYNNETCKKSRSVSRHDVHPDTIKTAVYIKHLFMKIVRGELQLRQRITQQAPNWHDGHSCEYFYTCAIDTNNVQRVLNGCRSLIIQNHLRRFGII